MEDYVQEPVVIYKYRDPWLDQVAHIKEYVKRTREIRQSWQLIVSDRAPYKAASPVLISKFLKEAIMRSGQFGTGRSVQSGSTTKVRLGGATLAEVLRAGNWARVSTFKEFYFKPDNDFLEAVLK